MAIRHALTAVVLLLVATGCADDRAADGNTTVPASRPDATAPATTRTTIPIPTTTLPDLTASAGLAASIRQFREDEAAGAIQIEIVRGPAGDAGATATDGGLVGVTGVRLRWPGLADVDATVHPVQVAAGQRVDIPTPLGEPRCATADPPSYSAGVVEMLLADGRYVQAPLLADAQVALDNVFAKGCVRQRLLAQVGLAYSSPWGRTDPAGTPTGTADLVVTRLATAEPVRITGVDGSVLLVVAPAQPLTAASATMPAGADTLRIPLVVTGAGRCDGHALSDSKRTYVFQVLVTVGDDRPVGVDVAVPQADRPVLNQVIVDTCGSDHHR
ncbi:MAG: hypothetical protein U0Q22_01065 [Acidimicrobiales bacterium]